MSLGSAATPKMSKNHKNALTEMRAIEYDFQCTSPESAHWGWDWGNQIGGAQWPAGKQGEVREGTITAEQMAEGWQENATLLRDEFFEAVGIEPI